MLFILTNELLDIPKLLIKAAKNLSVYQLIGWVYYYGTFTWGCKTAVQVGDGEYLDRMSSSYVRYYI